MKQALFTLAVLMSSIGFAVAQEGPLPNKDTDTVNEMNISPDQNQVLVGQRPNAARGGSAGLVPDYSDRVNGRAYPTSNNVAAPSNQGVIAGNPGGMDQHSASPLPDAQAIEAAKKGAAPTSAPEATQPVKRPETSSPGATAATRASTGGQSNETKQSRQNKEPKK